MDALKHYEAMCNQENAGKFFGTELPKLMGAALGASSKQIAASELLEEIKAFAADCGWVQYRDELRLLESAADVSEMKRTDLLEAQFAAGDRALHIRYIGSGATTKGKYHVTLFTSEKVESNASFVYSECQYYLRADLSDSQNRVIYRHWWHDAEQNGDWRPVAQQFVGFTQLEHSQGGN